VTTVSDKVHRVTVTIDVRGDAYRAGRVRAAMEEAAAQLPVPGELEDSSVERLDADEPNGFRPELDCWCGRPAQFAVPTVPYDGTCSPVCVEHVAECSESYELDELTDVELADKLGL
jgi:hypothetical protein